VIETGQTEALRPVAEPSGCPDSELPPRWRASPYSYERAAAIAGELGLSLTTASVLVRRGFVEPAAARRFLEGTETHDPFAFRGMAEAVELIMSHVRRGSPIAVHGDYDVDGVCSTALAVRTLRRLGADVRARLPSRSAKGYGLAAATVQDLHRQGARLLLTADCAIGAIEEVALAHDLGMEVVVTDHHRPGKELPTCTIVHPSVCGYPCSDLCATGVIYKLCEALHATLQRAPSELEEELDLVALATVADVVPLVGENRTFVKQGLRALAGTAKPGLRALMKVAGVEPQGVNEHAVGFVLAPRINAAGRLHRPDAALELLLTEDTSRALQVARELDAVNSERQAVETRILFEAERQLSASGSRRDDPLYVLAAQDWHPGVIGIVASRLVERYRRPCVMVALDARGQGRGSGRSIGAYDLHAGLAACAEHLGRFGGHRMAAGLELEADRLDRFRSDLVEHAATVLRAEDLVPVERVDAVIPGDCVRLDLADELELLRPFGMGNPAVNLLVPAARLSEVRAIGEGRHASLTFNSAGVRSRAVAFGFGSRLAGEPQSENRHDLVGRLEANEWRGAVEPRLVLRSIHPLQPPTSAESEPTGPGCADCACRARGAAWWAGVWREFDAAPEKQFAHGIEQFEGYAAERSPRVVVDLRGQGILGSLSELLSTEEAVLVVCADVSRRRALLELELDPARFGRPPAFVLSARCSSEAISAQLGSISERALCLIDYATIASDPSFLAHFRHLFALDPPPFEPIEAILRASAGFGAGASFLHLGWGPAELEFSRKTLEQDFGLRAPLAAVYRALVGHSGGLEGAALETALIGDGRHPRSAALVGRCLRVLAELGLVELERSSATVRCTITARERVELERSQAFNTYTALYQEALRFLSEPAQPMRTASAA
jgi:single-stranded-DNA-specific exonuclease